MKNTNGESRKRPADIGEISGALALASNTKIAREREGHRIVELVLGLLAGGVVGYDVGKPGIPLSAREVPSLDLDGTILPRSEAVSWQAHLRRRDP
jgi:hypothetical protein